MEGKRNPQQHSGALLWVVELLREWGLGEIKAGKGRRREQVTSGQVCGPLPEFPRTPAFSASLDLEAHWVELNLLLLLSVGL